VTAARAWTRGERLRLGRALLAALERDASAEGRTFAGRLEEIRGRAARLLPAVVGRPVAMPYLAGLDVGARIVYEGPPPFEHVLEYVEAAAQRWSWEDPRGPSDAAAADPPDRELTALLRDTVDLCRETGIGTEWAPRMILHAALHDAAGREAASARALAGLGSEAPLALERRAAWVARRLLLPRASAADIARDLGLRGGAEEALAATAEYAAAIGLAVAGEEPRPR